MGKENVEELVQMINKELIKGKSIAQIERENGIGKDTWRKKISRANYKYNANQKQYITYVSYTDNTNYNQHETDISYKDQETAYNNKKSKQEEEKMDNVALEKFKILTIDEKINLVNGLTNGKKNLKDIEEQLGFSNVGKYMEKSLCYWDGTKKIYIKIQKEAQFNREEIEFLKNLCKQQSIQKEIENVGSGKIITRSVRVDEKIFNLFAQYCKNNNITQVNAINKLLLDFIEN